MSAVQFFCSIADFFHFSFVFVKVLLFLPTCQRLQIEKQPLAPSGLLHQLRQEECGSTLNNDACRNSQLSFKIQLDIFLAQPATLLSQMMFSKTFNTRHGKFTPDKNYSLQLLTVLELQKG